MYALTPSFSFQHCLTVCGGLRLSGPPIPAEWITPSPEDLAESPFCMLDCGRKTCVSHEAKSAERKGDSSPFRPKANRPPGK